MHRTIVQYGNRQTLKLLYSSMYALIETSASTPPSNTTNAHNAKISQCDS